ncbi:hypothetical protein [Caldovatus aquaticus]|uniref:Uncharacterized protein n=1 Tax=Caldovatus aquaticus TaxID=2865671 RepID=A0ABS7F0N1_9PROT|nr:hypothetical protein [Caldovatus aquaticus]MBW8268315.1 hypothetical protein [Caldovatus aquaticus]
MSIPSEVAFEEDLPLPARVAAREENDRIRAALRALAPGQSFFLPCPEDVALARWQTRIAVVANRLLGAGQVATSQCVERGRRGVRVWKRGDTDA